MQSPHSSASQKSLNDNDRQRLEYLYDLFAPAVYGEICRLMGKGSAADELFCDIFIHCHHELLKVHQTGGKVLVWLLQLVHERFAAYQLNQGIKA